MRRLRVQVMIKSPIKKNRIQKWVSRKEWHWTHSVSHQTVLAWVYLQWWCVYLQLYTHVQQWCFLIKRTRIWKFTSISFAKTKLTPWPPFCFNKHINISVRNLSKVVIFLVFSSIFPPPFLLLRHSSFPPSHDASKIC